MRTATGFRSLAYAVNPSRWASTGMLPPPQKGSSTGGGFPPVERRISARASLENCLVRSVLPQHEPLDDPEQAGPLVLDGLRRWETFGFGGGVIDKAREQDRPAGGKRPTGPLEMERARRANLMVFFMRRRDIGSPRAASATSINLRRKAVTTCHPSVRSRPVTIPSRRVPPAPLRLHLDRSTDGVASSNGWQVSGHRPSTADHPARVWPLARRTCGREEPASESTDRPIKSLPCRSMLPKGIIGPRTRARRQGMNDPGEL